MTPKKQSDTLLVQLIRYHTFMPTIKKRINITFSEDMEMVLKKIAKRDEVPEATKASELLRLALEIEEDEAWETVATLRDEDGGQFYSHKKAWG